jgi:hypothetical protein
MRSFLLAALYALKLLLLLRLSLAEPNRTDPNVGVNIEEAGEEKGELFLDDDEELHRTLRTAFFDGVIGGKSAEEIMNSGERRHRRLERISKENSELQLAFLQLSSESEEVLIEGLESLECLVHGREISEDLMLTTVYERLVEMLSCRGISNLSSCKKMSFGHQHSNSMCLRRSCGRFPELAALTIGAAVQHKPLVAEYFTNISLSPSSATTQIASDVVLALVELAEDVSNAVAARRALYALACLARTHEIAAVQIARAM